MPSEENWFSLALVLIRIDLKIKSIIQKFSKSKIKEENQMKSNEIKKKFQLNIEKFLFNIRKKIIQNQKISI